MRAAPALGALTLALAGCAATPLPPPRELLLAQRVLARAAASPFATEAAAEVGAAEAALTQAERAHAASPGSGDAFDDAYVALRTAQKALVAGRYEADRIALEKARGAAQRLEADGARREAFFASLARRRAARAEAQAELRRAHREALERARGPRTQILEQADTTVFRMSAEELFLPGTSLLRDGAMERLGALGRGLAAAPPYTLRVSVLNDVEGFKSAAAILAERRRIRVERTLRAYGVPEAAFLKPERPPPGAQIDVVVIEPTLPLSPDE